MKKYIIANLPIIIDAIDRTKFSTRVLIAVTITIIMIFKK